VLARGEERLQGSGLNGFSTSGTYSYLFELPPQLTGKDILESSVTADVDADTGAPIVTLRSRSTDPTSSGGSRERSTTAAGSTPAWPAH